jgi:hypothetical protein
LRTYLNVEAGQCSLSIPRGKIKRKHNSGYIGRFGHFKVLETLKEGIPFTKSRISGLLNRMIWPLKRVADGK